jgi:hypothetical protein
LARVAVGAEVTCEFLSFRDRFDGDDESCGVEPCAGGGHEPDGSLGKDGDGPAARDAGVLDGHEAGADHIGDVDGHLIRDGFGDMGHIGVGLVDEEVLGEDAVFFVGELPAAERATGLG